MNLTTLWCLMGALQFTALITVKLVIGGTATLPCLAYSNASMNGSVTWTDANNVTLTYQQLVLIVNNRISIDSSEGEYNLVLKNVSFYDQGTYICDVRRGKYLSRRPVYLDILFRPVIFPDKHDRVPLNVLQGSTVVLNCTAYGNPTPNIIWRHEGPTPVCSGITNLSIFKEGSVIKRFILRNITRRCSGSYECIAGNGILPNARKTREIKVEYPPVASTRSLTISVHPGMSVITLTCVLEAYPLPLQVIWEFRAKPITNDSKYNILTRVFRKSFSILSYLNIRNVQSEDFGTYTCAGMNDLCKSSTTLSLIRISRDETTKIVPHPIFIPTTYIATQPIASNRSNQTTNPTTIDFDMQTSTSSTLIRTNVKDGNKMTSQKEPQIGERALTNIQFSTEAITTSALITSKHLLNNDAGTDALILQTYPGNGLSAWTFLCSVLNLTYAHKICRFKRKKRLTINASPLRNKSSQHGEINLNLYSFSRDTFAVELALVCVSLFVFIICVALWVVAFKQLKRYMQRNRPADREVPPCTTEEETQMP